MQRTGKQDINNDMLQISFYRQGKRDSWETCIKINFQGKNILGKDSNNAEQKRKNKDAERQWKNMNKETLQKRKKEDKEIEDTHCRNNEDDHP